MPAYVIVQIDVTDPAQYEEYKKAVPAAIHAYGGRYLIRGGVVEVLDGRHDGRRLVMLEFPTMDAVRAWWASPEYQASKRLRYGAATMDAWAVPGAQ
ncbi:MAG: DUF1330 domain-containing protein [Chloroflexi bacterium]|nr:DUF1330 domain-containing protein [Chloroflexota bacterium]